MPDRPERRRVTPAAASEVIMAWILRHWASEKVNAAVEKTGGVIYNAEFVHKYTPWKGIPFRFVGLRD